MEKYSLLMNQAARFSFAVTAGMRFGLVLCAKTKDGARLPRIFVKEYLL